MKKLLALVMSLFLLATMIPLGAVNVSAAWSTSYSITGNGANDIVAVAQAQLERTQSQLGYSGQWCAAFVSDCANRAGQSEAVPYDASTSRLYNKVMAAGGQVVTLPQKGDIAFYKEGSTFKHVSIVSGDDGTTIHGNVSWCTSKGKDEGVWHVCTRKPNVYENAMGQYHVYVRPNYKGDTHDTHNYNTYVYYEAAHPHYKCYQCSCGEVKANYSETTYVSTCETCNPPCTHAYDNACDTTCNNCGATREVNAHSWANATCTVAKTCTICSTTEGTPLGHNWDIAAGRCIVCGENVSVEYSEWLEELPADITEDLFDIESKTAYRYRDNSSHISYGAWGAEQTSSTKLTESDTLTIVSTTTYYNYYHYCCNYYSGSYNVDSIPYGSGGQYHTIRLTYELSPKNVGDKGGKTLYGSCTCSKGFNVWAKADQYITYEYKYKTRTATTVVDYGTWTDWSETAPSAADNRDIETKTLYRYKLKHVHIYDDDYDATCNTCGDIREVPEKPPVTPDLPADAPAFVVESTTAREGEEFTIAIRTERNSGIVSFKLNLIYDAAVLELVSVEEKDFVNVSFGPTENNPFVLNWVDALHPNNSTNGVVALVTFRVKEGADLGKTEIALSYDADDVYDQNYGNVAFRVENGYVEIVDYVSGDVNGDGKINNKDLGLLQQYVNGWTVTVSKKAADANGDGKVNNKDLGLLQQYLNGWNVELG